MLSPTFFNNSNYLMILCHVLIILIILYHGPLTSNVIHVILISLTILEDRSYLLDFIDEKFEA